MSDSATAFQKAYDAMLSQFTTPVESRDVPTPGGSTRVQIFGRPDAPPLVLLHGFKVTSTMWAPNAAHLGAVRRVYAPDTLGDYGFSRADKPPRSLDELLVWLGALLDALGIHSTDLGGMSYGGWLSAHFAARHPERVRKLVLIAPGASFGKFTFAWYARGIPMLVFKRRQDVDAYLRWAGVPPVGERAAAYERTLGGLVDVMHQGHRHFPIFGLPVPKPLPESVTSAISAPTLVVYGVGEKQYAAAPAVERAKQTLKNVQTVLIPEASHDLTMAQPEAVAEAVTKFLAD